MPNTGAGDASSGKVDFTIRTTGEMNKTLKFRIPDWAPSNPELKINGVPVEDYTVEGGYIVLTQSWTDGTTIELDFPMEVVLYDLPDNENVVAFKYGPGWKENIKENLVKTEGKLEFTLKGTDADNGILTFTPHFERYEDRYGIYFELVTADSESYQRSILQAKEKGRAETATVSSVIVANDQYELAANRQTVNSTVGVFNGSSYRDVRAGGYFSYDLEVKPGAANYLYATYYSGDVGRTFDIYVDDQKLVTEVIQNKNPGDFNTQTHKITQDLVENSRTKTVTETDNDGNTVQREVKYVTVKFASTGGFVGGIFDIFRIITDYKTNPNLDSLSFNKGDLSESFDLEVTEYTLTVPTSTESVDMSVSLQDQYGLVYIGDTLINDSAERKIALTTDTTKVVLTTKAEDHKTSKQYTITIVKRDVVQEEPGDDNETPVEDNDSKGKDMESSKGEKLPNTATNIYNYLDAGILLLVTGAMTSLKLRRRKSM
nr:DUF6805 domain-containing protein [Bacillus sp. MRMR6]